jgi:hypothetical protein
LICNVLRIINDRRKSQDAGFPVAPNFIPANERGAVKRRGVGERWRKSFSSRPLMTGCGVRTLYPELCQLALEVRELQASVSPTPFVIDSGVASDDPAAVSRLAKLHLKSSG